MEFTTQASKTSAKMSRPSQDIEKPESIQTLPNEDEVSVAVEQEPEPPIEKKDSLQHVATSRPSPENDNEPEYVSGLKLILATGIVALASFTMLLDTSIVVTVSH